MPDMVGQLLGLIVVIGYGIQCWAPRTLPHTSYTLVADKVDDVFEHVVGVYAALGSCKTLAHDLL